MTLPTDQPLWYIDPAAGDDSASGDAPAFALRTFAELVRRYGTIAPTLRIDVTITFLSSHVDDSDPVIFCPVLAHAAAVLLLGTLSSPVASVTLASVTARHRATQTFLQATSGATAARQLVVNATHPSRAWTYKARGGGSFAMTQPLAPASFPYSVFASNPRVDAWADGDSVAVYELTRVNLARLAPVVLDLDETYAGSLMVQQIRCFDPTGESNGLEVNAWVNFVESDTADRALTVIPSSAEIGGVFSNALVSDVVCNALNNAPYFFAGAVVGASAGITGCVGNLDADIILGGGGAAICGQWASGVSLVGACIDTGSTLVVVPGGILIAGSAGAYGAAVLWGPGTLDVHAARFTYLGAAADTLACGALRIDRQATAEAYSTAAGVGTWYGPRDLTVAHLDASVASGGFGGRAMQPGGGSIVAGPP